MPPISPCAVAIGSGCSEDAGFRRELSSKPSINTEGNQVKFHPKL